jgi:hypothetical protein
MPWTVHFKEQVQMTFKPGKAVLNEDAGFQRTAVFLSGSLLPANLNLSFFTSSFQALKP